jgi:hypothetical protein
VNGNNWRELYRAAILEVNMEKMGERVKAVEEAIRARASLDDGIPSEERIAIEDAVSALSILKRERS